MNRVATIAFLFFFAISPYLGIPAWTPSLAAVACLFALSLVGLNLVFGVSGMLALGQAAFMALPAYVSGMAVSSMGVPIALAMLSGVAVTTIVALLIGLIFIRLPGIYFAIGTIGFAFVLEGLTRAFPSATGGASGLVLTGFPHLSSMEWHLLSIVLLLMGLACYQFLLRGAWYRALRLVREDELAAQTLGVDVAREKIKVFVAGSAFSAVGGVFLGYYTGVVVPESGGVNQSLELLAMMIIGGAGTLLGPVLGSGLIHWLFSISGAAGHYELLVYGGAFLTVMLFAPQGMLGTIAAAVRSRQPGRTIDAPRYDPIVASDEPKRLVGAQCLRVESVTKRYGGLTAVDGVGVTVHFGEILALIGPNGAGKSTFFNVLSGIEIPDLGAVYICSDKPASNLIHVRARDIGRSFQVPRLVQDMTVLENLILRVDRIAEGKSTDQRLSMAMMQLEKFGLASLAHRAVRQLSLGHHKQIELARASLGDPLLLLMDEPAVGLSETEVQRLSAMLRQLKERGAAILVVEHNMRFVASVADRVVVMNEGRLLAEGAPEDVMRNEDVKRAYFGALA